MEKLDYQPPDMPLSILHCDEHLLVVDKPSGLLSVPGKAVEHSDCLESRVRNEYQDALLIHRLDMDTSGVMIFARSKAVQRHLGLQFEKRKTTKIYVARVDGNVLDEHGEINLPLIVDWPNRPLQKVDHEIGKSAKTLWKILDREQNATRIELRPVTGRSHQLRVHMKELGHVILGDRFYGDHTTIQSADRLQLHAHILEIHHPKGGNKLSFCAPMPF